jgi:putative transposase
MQLLVQRSLHHGKPTEGIWSSLKRGPLACPAFSDLARAFRHGLQAIQRQPRLIEGCLAETGLTMETA